jgi:hypothetical protein
MTTFPARLALLASSSIFLLGASDYPRQVVTKGLGYFPVAISLKNGDVLAVVRGGAAHVGVKGRLDLVRSTDRGKTWSAPWTAVDEQFDDRNPAMGQLKDGTIVLAYVVASGYDATGLRLGKGEERVFDGVYLIFSKETTTHYPPSALPRARDHHASASPIPRTISGGPSASPHAWRLAVRAHSAGRQ